MSANSPGEISQLLQAWSAGDRSAFDRLTPLVYEELRRIAGRHMAREKPDHTLQATALVNEAYFRLVDSTRMQWRDRAHFFAMSSQLMRRILIDYSRRHNAKRGANLQRISLDDGAILARSFSEDFIELDNALNKLAAVDERKATIVEMRFFGGLTVEETSDALGIAPITVIREWNFAKAWLYRELSEQRSA